jgi:hypothetical protein
MSLWEVYDMSGRLAKYENAIQLNVEDLSPGIYIVRVDGKFIERIVKI